MNDYEEIRKLLYRYAFHVDRREFEELGDLLAAATFSLIWDGAGVEKAGITGREAIVSFYEDHLRDRRPSRHVITNAVIDISDDGKSAFVEAYITSVGYDPEPPPVLLSGYYEDRFEKVGGAWRFTEKKCIMELPPNAS